MELTGTWRAAVADETLRRQFHLPEFDDDAWERVEVPGHWHDVAALRGETSVLHRRSFDHEIPDRDGGRAWLELDGVCYQGDVWLDGAYLGDTEGYFVRHAFDVTDALQAGREHHLGIEVNCSPGGRDGKRRGLLGVLEGGTDMVPDRNPGGIWAPVRIRHTGPVRIDNLRAICVEADDRSATVAIRALLQTESARSVRILTDIADVHGELEQSLAEGQNEVEWRVDIPDPELWWPRSLGAQPLYELSVRVETRTDEVSDQFGLRVGLRSLRVRRWQFHVNGERLFLKGVNTGPVAESLAGADDEAVRRRLDLAVEAGFDLVRPYAHVAPDAFYESADRLGLLVWQDLPMQGAVSTGVRGEAVRQARAMVDQLGHHPSVAVWNAHVSPAPEVMDASLPTPRRTAERLLAHQLPTWSKSVLDRSVKRVFDNLDGSRHTCGFTGVHPHLPRLDASATHLWFGWRRGSERRLPDYAAQWPAQVRFVAEFGAQSVPDDVSFLDDASFPDLTAMGLSDDPSFEASSFGRYVPPDDHPSIEAWVEATQLYQAGLLRRQIEALRRIKYRPTGGFCVHHLADAHPCASASLVAAGGRAKLAFDAVGEVCRPVIIVADRMPARLMPGDPLALDIHVVNDLRTSFHGEVEAELGWPGDHHRWRFSGDVEADSVTRVGTLSWVVPETPGVATLSLHLRGPHEAVNRYDATIR